MSLHIHEGIEQGSQEWLDLRRGIPTASTIGQLITPKTLKVAANDASRSLVAQLVAERITGFTADTYVSYEMEQGHVVEPIVRELYSKHFAPVTEVAFMTRRFNGQTLGYSPDGLVGDEGLIEIKSRQPKKHLQTILAGTVPAENIAQCQAGLLVSGRSWLDYVSYSGGMPLWVHRVYPEPDWQAALLEALESFERTAEQMVADYTLAVEGMPATERIEPFPEMEF